MVNSQSSTGKRERPAEGRGRLTNNDLRLTIKWRLASEIILSSLKTEFFSTLFDRSARGTAIARSVDRARFDHRLRLLSPQERVRIYREVEERFAKERDARGE